MAKLISGTEFDDDDISNPALVSFEDGDVVEGRGGNDVLAAFGYDTTLDGGPGHDTLYSFGSGPNG